MPLFAISNQRRSAMEQSNFSAEKPLQGLIEKNLQTVFNCRFVASEFQIEHSYPLITEWVTTQGWIEIGQSD